MAREDREDWLVQSVQHKVHCRSLNRSLPARTRITRMRRMVTVRVRDAEAGEVDPAPHELLGGSGRIWEDSVSLPSGDCRYLEFMVFLCQEH